MIKKTIFFVMVSPLVLAIGAPGCGPNSTNSSGPENTADACQDTVDNDNDGLTDCADDECATFVFCQSNDGSVPDSSFPDASLTDGGGADGFEECASAEGQAVNVTLPVDIIFAVDTSGSMDQENDAVEDYIDDFAIFIASSGLDYHVIMIADNDICVPSPPAGPNCSDSANFRHVVHKVDSQEPYSDIVQQYPAYQDFLRPDAKVTIVVVTDDDDDQSYTWFQNQMANLTNPGFPDGFTFFGIVTYPGVLPMLPCCNIMDLQCGAAVGDEYIDFAPLTGGQTFSICDDTSTWGDIFTVIANNVMIGTELPCTYVIPDPGGGQEIHPDLVNVEFIPDQGTPWVIRNVPDSSLCGNEGWYYDDPQHPTQVILCPETCQGLSEGDLKIIFGCATVVD